MASLRQIKSLVKQELRRGMRSQYVIFSFIIFPLMMWGIQAGVQSVVTSSVDTSGEIIYVANLDGGVNDTVLGDVLVDQLEQLTQEEDSSIYDAQINSSIQDLNEEEIRLVARDRGLSPMVIIPQNFTSVHQDFVNVTHSTAPTITILSLPADTFITLSTRTAINQIVSQPPFTQVTIHKATTVQSEQISFEGEEEAGDPLEGIAFAAFFTILLAVLAPAAFVASSFAGEREKRTLEALLALPMERSAIMGGKIIAGLMMTMVFAVMNIVGLFLFNFIAPEAAIEVNFSQILIISAVLLLTSFVAIGFGIAIASLAKDQRTANTLYQMIMMIPTMLVGFAVLFNGVPETFDVLYLIPWVHSMAVMMKGVYPQTYANSTLTSSVTLDILMHLGYLLVFVLVFIFLSAKLFNRENIIS